MTGVQEAVGELTGAVASRAEVCTVACAEAWRGDGEIVASPMGIIPSAGARLARATFEPDLLLTDGEARYVAGTWALGEPAPGPVEGWVPFRSAFDLLWHGSRHVMMSPAQIDRYGNANISAIGDYARPTRQLLGVRGAPGNTVNHPTSYWVRRHLSRVFVPRVDMVSGVGYDRASAAGAAYAFLDLRRVVTNLAVLDFGGPDHTMRLVSVHPGVSIDDVVARTGFELVIGGDVPQTRQPTAAELALIRDVIDPAGLPRQRGGRVTEPQLPPPQSPHPGLRTAICDLFGVKFPIVQTGMGWVSTPELTAATSNAGALGILASGTLTLAETDAAIGRIRELTSKPFGVNLRGDAPDVAERSRLLVKRGVRVASFALAPNERVIRSLKDDGLVVVPSIGARRHAEKVAAWGVDAVIVQGGEGGGHTGSVPTSILLPQVADAVDVPVIGAGGFYDGRGLVAALAYGAAGVAMGTRFLLTNDSPVPDSVKAEYLRRTVTDTVVTSVLDGVPQRMLRTPLVDQLVGGGRLSLLRRSVRHARAFQTMSGTPWRDIVAKGLAMKRSQELTWTQVIMAANTPMMLRASMVDGRTDLGTLASGQVAGVIDDLPSCAELVERIIAQATAVLERLAPVTEA